MTAAATKSDAIYDLDNLRAEFPILSTQVNQKPLIYLDNAATTQKPAAVIASINKYYSEYNANVHRGVHELSVRATDAFEHARERVKTFINASSIEEIVFTRGTTEAINLVASSYGAAFLQQGDEVLVTELEHHSNIVPWQMLCQQKNLELKVVPVLEDGSLDVNAFHDLLSSKTKLFACGHVSNALGTINPIKDLVSAAKKVGAVTLVDGAQAVPHCAVDVEDIGCDFYAFSGHKIYGPTGIGVLFGRKVLLEKMPPYQGGGDMIRKVSFSGTEFNDLPYKFEAGTPFISGAISLAVALDFVDNIGLDNIARHEAELLAYATSRLGQVNGLRLIGTAANKAAVLSFVMENIHASDIGTLLDKQGIAVRAGHHCAMPVLEKFGLAATCRASFGMYNTIEEVDALANGIAVVQEIFGV